ncbi:MAG TPA: thioredoxin domain-containing protein, partial [Vicinamibacterales bacterium]
LMNRLAREQSPYLLQHAHNPVDWYPWGDEAFARARSEDKPIFLSIGYATCHWCHVMERESFENAGIAKVLNDLFISIKVDREERPDVDRVYMTFVQATTGSGGWPMSVWLTPDLQPFYGGTYYPPAAQWGRPGFVEVLTEIGRAWREDRLNVVQSAAQIVERLSQMARGQDEAKLPDEGALTRTFQQFQQSFDARRGGFGDAPKFPRPSELLFLLREYARIRLREDATARPASDAALAMVVQTLRAMALGGMRDHIGGGFHRYSVDGNWRVPHFEKMLYDQAQIVLACLEASQAAAEPFFAQIAEDTLQYVRRDMTDKGGGFYSAEDADSLPHEAQAREPASPQAHAHKVEGAFYVWTAGEIKTQLGDDSAVFEARYGILPSGNAPFDPQNEFVNKNLLYTAQSIADIAKTTHKTPMEVAEALLRARQVLFNVRELRPRPQLDDKVLTAWNGLMIAAFARASRVLGGMALGAENAETARDSTEITEGHLRSAGAAASFIRKTMWQPQSRTLLRRYRAGDAAIEGYAEDYAYLIFGVLELFQASGDPQWLSWARELQARQDELFWDEKSGGWFSTTGADPSVLVRMKEDYDGAEPAPTSVSAMNLLTLAHLTGERGYGDRAREAIASFGGRLEEMGRAVPFMAAALSAAIAEGEQIVIVGPRNSGETAALWIAANKHYRPFSVITRVEPSELPALAEHMPWTADMKMIDGKPTAYVCRGFVCDAPSTDPSVFSSRSLGEGALE